MYHQPSIYIGNLRFDEPVTTITDLVVSFICFYAFYQITTKREKNKINTLFKYYFLSMGIATSIGGIVGHGFLYAFNYNEALEVSPWKLPGWLTSMFSVALIERASIEYARVLIKPRTGKFFAWMNIIELTTFVTLTFSTLNFFFVEVHSAYGLLIVVTSFQSFVYYKTKNRVSKLMLIAVGFSALAALIFMNEWGISKWITHFDISHVLMSISAIFFYKGAIDAKPLKITQ